ncbi:MAG: zinc ribbon domain-containing protein, partial [Lachnospiraceae bacterium]|nr:zinc ribbon domain-containing protein [Lachnospiraceae bacterium]
MNKEKATALCKWTSVALVILSLLFLYKGVISVKDKDSKSKLANKMKKGVVEYSINQEDLEEIKLLIGMWGVEDEDVEAYYSKLLDMSRALMDAQITYSENVKVGPKIVSLSKSRDMDDAITYILRDRYENIFDIADECEAMINILLILYYLSLVVGLITIILHIKDKKFSGYVFAILRFVSFIFLGIEVHIINAWAKDFMDIDGRLVKLTWAPFWAFIFALLGALLWKNKDAVVCKVANNDVKNLEINEKSDSTKKCPNCGQALSIDAIFCNNCGTRFENKTK